MSRSRYLAPCLLLLLALVLATFTACNGTVGSTASTAAGTTSSAGLVHADTSSSTTEADTQMGPATTVDPSASGALEQVLVPEELLTAEEASSMVGVTASIIDVSSKITDTGEIYAEYQYEFEGGTVVYAMLYLTQNALIPSAELKLGHNAKWAFEESKKGIPVAPVDLPGSGAKSLQSFYNENNMDVSVLFQDYYILVAFSMDADDAATLAVNTAIASHVITEISLADVSLTGD